MRLHPSLSLTQVRNLAGLLCLAWFSWLMLRITLQYFPFNTNAAFLQIKQTEVHSVKGYVPVFYVHVTGSIIVLLAGFTQFSHYILKNAKRLHRSAGYLYLTAVILFAAPSGFFIGVYANGGLSSKIAFTLLATLWFFYTSYAGYLAIKGKYKLHSYYMYRSYALALSAITLRLWKYLIVWAFEPPPMDVYRFVAWFGWVPNLILAEYLIRRKKSKPFPKPLFNL